MIRFILNNKIIETHKPDGMILLDFIREEEGLTGTKEACREGECGACTVLIGRLNNEKMEYKTIASCITPIGSLKNCHIVTVEGLDTGDFTLVQKLIIDNSASQCGYCTPGIVLSMTGFCFMSEEISYDAIIDALDGNICRCTGYASIRNAGRSLIDNLKANDYEKTAKKDRLQKLIEMNIIPSYFAEIPEKLKKIGNRSNINISDETLIVVGATDLFVQKPEALENQKLYFMSERKDLEYIKEENGNILVGGAVAIEDFRKSQVIKKHYPELEDYLLLHSSTILRNTATLSGNIVNASPIGDITIILLALSARLVIENRHGNIRKIELSKFYISYKKYDLEPCEIIREIEIPICSKNEQFNFEKVSNRKILDIASVNSAALIKLSDKKNIEKLRISAGGVAPIPLLLSGLEKFIGKELSAKLIQEIAEYCMQSVTPIDDIRGSAKYKKILLKQLIIAHFNKINTVQK